MLFHAGDFSRFSLLALTLAIASVFTLTIAAAIAAAIAVTIALACTFHIFLLTAAILLLLRLAHRLPLLSLVFCGGWWAVQDLNLRPPPCKGGALPLS